MVDKESNNLIKYVYNPDPETGKYLMIFPPGKNYDMVVEAEGYSPYVFNIHIPNQTYFYQMHQTMYLRTIEFLDDTLGQGISIENTFYDLMTPEERKLIEEKNQQEIRKADEELLSLIEQIFESGDTLAFQNLNETAEDIYYETDVEKKKMNPLLSLVEQIIEYTDSVAMKNLENITEQGFFEKSDNEILQMGKNKNVALEPFAVGNDTIYVIIPRKKIENKDSIHTEIKEKHEEIVIKSIVAKIVHYENNSTTIANKYISDLDKICEMLNEFKKWKVEISGYTDNMGSDKYNLNLSMQRSNVIKEYFEKKGIDGSRIKINYFGKSSPKASNETEEGRALNRRTEITVLQATIKEKLN